jgi:hypothetical protein
MKFFIEIIPTNSDGFSTVTIRRKTAQVILQTVVPTELATYLQRLFVRDENPAHEMMDLGAKVFAGNFDDADAVVAELNEAFVADMRALITFPDPAKCPGPLASHLTGDPTIDGHDIGKYPR